MEKIRNLADLRKMKEGMQSRMAMRENSESSDAIIQIKVGMATSGIASGAKETMSYLISELDKRQIKALVMQVGDKVKVSFNLKSREYNGRWYNDLQIWKIAPAGAQPAAPAPAPQAQPAPQAPAWAPAPAPTLEDMPADSEGEEDLPF